MMKPMNIQRNLWRMPLALIQEEYGIKIHFETESGIPEIDHSMDSLEEQLYQAKDYLDQLRNSDGVLNLEDNNVIEAMTKVQQLVLEKQKLNEPAYMTFDTSGYSEDQVSFIESLQQMQNLSNAIELNVALGLDASSTEEQLYNLAAELAASTDGPMAEIKAQLGLEGLTAEEIIAKLPEIKIPVTFVPSPQTPVPSDTTTPVEQTQTVTKTTKFVSEGAGQVIEDSNTINNTLIHTPDARPNIFLNTFPFLSGCSIVQNCMNSMNNSRAVTFVDIIYRYFNLHPPTVTVQASPR